MKIAILSRSQMLVEMNNKKLIIQGEATLTPAFYADRNSIKHWEEPNQNIEITELEKIELIQKIIEESEKSGFMKIIFE